MPSPSARPTIGMPSRSSRRVGRQGHLCPETAVHDDRRRPRGERHRPGEEARLPDRQPAALRLRSSASPANWSATAASASCTPSRSACRWIHPAATRPEMPVPPNLNYEMWLGCTPKVPYTEDRVHPQSGISDRPGWLRIDSYCLGMITGWGSHHVDIGHWGMGTEFTGPISSRGQSRVPEEGPLECPRPLSYRGEVCQWRDHDH